MYYRNCTNVSQLIPIVSRVISPATQGQVKVCKPCFLSNMFLKGQVTRLEMEAELNSLTTRETLISCISSSTVRARLLQRKEDRGGPDTPYVGVSTNCVAERAIQFCICLRSQHPLELRPTQLKRDLGRASAIFSTLWRNIPMPFSAQSSCNALAIPL